MLWTLLIGLLVGLVAKFLMPGRDPGGFIVTILLGIGGSLLASWAGVNYGYYSEGEPVGFVAAVAGAMVMLILFRMLFGSRDRF